MAEDKKERAAAKNYTKVIKLNANAAKLTAQAAKLAAKWQGYRNKAKGIETNPYNMKSQFEKATGIEHKTLGWGYIIDNRNGRLEVLFQDGIKYLISNYK